MTLEIWKDVLERGSVFFSSGKSKKVQQLFSNLNLDLLALMTSNLDGCNRYDEAYYATSHPIRTNVAGVKMPKFRPWARDISKDIRHLIAQGIDNKMNSRGIPQRRREFSGLEPISIGQLSTLFFMYLLGIVISLIAFCLEKL